MLDDTDIENIKSGNAVLLLGAGASFNSTRFVGSDPILGAKALSKLIADEIGLDYYDESLREVYDAAISKKDKSWIQELLKEEYTGIAPCQSTHSLFRYPWYRVYTLNIDDSLYNLGQNNKAQTLRFVNGANSDRIEWEGHTNCQIVHLHGMAWEIENGIVFSDEEYGTVYERRLGWYQQLREDFIKRHVYIIGSNLDEPFILSLIKKERVALQAGNNAKLIIPNELSPVRQTSLTLAKITQTTGTLESFVDFIYESIGETLPVSEIVATENDLKSSLIAKFSERDIAALQGLRSINREYLLKIADRPDTQKSAERNSFFQGYGPNWGIIADKTFASLSQFESLNQQLSECTKTERLTVVLGEAGSGKSTFAKQFCTHLIDSSEVGVFEYIETSAPFNDVMSALKQLVGDEKAIVLIDDFQICADDVSRYLSLNKDRNISIVTSARTTEWNSVLSKRFNRNTPTFFLNRYSQTDNIQLVDLIEQKFVAPDFNKLDREDRISRFQKSRKQLLFAIREASQSKIFEDIISDEVSGINNSDTKLLLTLVSVATAARTGIREEVARSIIDEIQYGTRESELRTHDERINELQGIIDKTANGSYRVRHDNYASTVIERHVPKEMVLTIIKEIAKYYSQFKTPIITNITKSESQLFKYVLNNRNIFNLFHKKLGSKKTIGIYLDMEQRLQLDGHYWLQYSLMHRRLGNQFEALAKLEKSVEAFPNNDYAWHALAQQKLILAATSKQDEKVQSEILIEEAEEELMRRHYSSADGTMYDEEQYPLTVLGHYHIDALIHLEKRETARDYAKKYFNLIVETEKRHDQVWNLDALKIKLMNLASNNSWKRNNYKIGKTVYF